MHSFSPVVETKPAPAPLLLTQAFVNTWEGDSGRDLLADRGTGGVWLASVGLRRNSDAARPDELHLARSVREGVRALLVANNGGPLPDADDLRPLTTLARAHRLRIGIAPDGGIDLDPEVDDTLERGLFSLLLVIRDAQLDGTWPRLKACGNPECRWAFYDRSHSRRGIWCDMAVCGNRIKNRKLRERRR
jgi:predicted RNA-binding Zn ribbon-like protein